MREIALFSAWEKEGIASLARAFLQMNYELVATGKTRAVLEAEGLKVIDISDLTGEPERFGGRLKTLHHKVLGGILFRPGQDESEWPYDFRIAAVVCNFYPFVEKSRSCKDLKELAEWVDIGGPTMVRAAAKNHPHVWIFTRPEQYTRFIASPADGRTTLRERLALEAFEEVAHLDEAIVAGWMERLGMASKLSYGENPHQEAVFIPQLRVGLKSYGSLSYNNVRDAEAALRFVAPFRSPAVSVIKHQTLCGAAVGLAFAKPDEVFRWAWEGDPVSRFGGVLAFNFVPAEASAITEVLRTKFLELVLMPRTPESEALAERLRQAKDRLKIVLVNPTVATDFKDNVQEIHQGVLGRLVQSSDRLDTAGHDTESHKLDWVFGQWAAACSKSNAMVLTGFDEKSSVAYLAGAGQGQPNRVEALELLALPRAEKFCERLGLKMSELTCFSDAFLPFDDSLRALHRKGVKRLVQPGGSKADAQVAETAKQLGIDMKMTHQRHFWH